MKEELIKFETAKLAKEKGFDINVNFSYDTTENNILEGEVRKRNYNGFVG